MVHPDDFHHGFTFSGHPRGVRRRSENLEIIKQEKLVPGVKEFTGPAVAKMLAKLKYHPLVGEVRSIGLLGAIELVADKRARRCFRRSGPRRPHLPRPLLPRRLDHASSSHIEYLPRTSYN